jgi:SAM-dependent methyltransferase
MPESQTEDVRDTMRSEWNLRAEEDANYYVAFGRRNQPLEEFFASAADQVRAFETELRRKPASFWAQSRAVEIGCGPGRLLKPLSRHFRELHGLDVSDAMIRRAAANLAGTDNIRLHHAADSSLSQFADASVGFVYSYAVFQHIPSRDVVMGYLREVVRVLAPGGLFVFQINGLPNTDREATTWDGVRVSAEEIIAFARESGMLLLQLNDKDTQYMWVTFQKPETTPRESTQPVRLAKLRNAFTGDPVIPASGRFAAAAICLEHLPEDADLLSLRARFDGCDAYAFFVSPEMTGNGIRELNVMVPPGTRTGLVPLEVTWRGKPLFAPAIARLVLPTARVPRLCALSDGINLLAPNRIESGFGKLVLEEVADPGRVQIEIDNVATRTTALCVNPFRERWEFNFFLPLEIGSGEHRVRVSLGGKQIASVPVQVAEGRRA